MNFSGSLDWAMGQMRKRPSIANQACCADEINDDFTIDPTHLGSVVCVDKATALTVTIPNDTNLPDAKHPIEVHIFNHGAGSLILAAESPVSIVDPYNVTDPKFFRLKKRSPNVWHVLQTQ